MPRNQRIITAEDIMDLGAYETIRAEKRQENLVRKRFRRLSVGPYVTVHFENWDTMWWQIHEMLRIEKGGEEQLKDEMAAYNPMIPNGRDLTCTLMFEIDDPKMRARVLGRLGGIEDHIYLSIDGERVNALPEGDVERSNVEGKASSVHFLHFPFTDAQIAAWKSEKGQAMFHIDHSNYGHIAIIGPEMRSELARDF
ncbi:DUF3501 family protein [Rhizorhapis suberifaciens]|uniref:DUF3501 family protein n=1 Tax=Rhizorhapis suberifaciens TaxID=13656 RepID=A0A840HVX6_9SPHN|nr:DUF3501 family protein [Rhizorhapis suberifaciens]MBB4641688.1 hypothetical protein [Rhizorhapis suberifaciens]